MDEQKWMLYGANGYTGRLIIEEALKRGHKPTLAGRSRDKLESLAREFSLPFVVVGLDDSSALTQALKGHSAVLHAAGPFIRTSEPMINACLATRAHYLDITGEVPVFVRLFERDAEAKDRKVALISGVGFDVVPTDCLARFVAEHLANASHLEIALASRGGLSSGTARSAVLQVPNGSWVRRNGQMMRQSLGRGVRKIRFSDRERWAAPAPLGDVVTAFHSTRIGNITAYMSVNPRVAQAFKWGWPLSRPLGEIAKVAFSITPVREALENFIERNVSGPNEEKRSGGRSHIWACALADSGQRFEAWLEMGEGYTFTACSAVRAVERVLADHPAGALSPAQALGADFVLDIPGVTRIEELPARPVTHMAV
jgi:short subunit dehydrogenase-like uncharacterized protein